MRGRPPKPTHLRLLEGNPSKRPLPELEPTVSGCAMKSALVAQDEVASSAWDDLVGAMPPGFFTAADSAALEQYALAWSLFDKAQREISQHGLVIAIHGQDEETGKLVFKRSIANPAIRIWKMASEALIKLTDRLGLSPVARARLHIPRAADRQVRSRFDGLLGPAVTRSSR